MKPIQQLQQILTHIHTLGAKELLELRPFVYGIQSAIDTHVLGLQQQMMLQNSDSLLTVKEVAARLRVSTDWIYKHKRELPFTVNLGQELRFSSRGLDAWILEQRAMMPPASSPEKTKEASRNTQSCVTEGKGRSNYAGVSGGCTTVCMAWSSGSRLAQLIQPKRTVSSM